MVITVLCSTSRIHEKQCFIDNKCSGFDVQDLRIGGLIRRTNSARKRILNYVNGKIDKIEELDEQLIPYPNSEAEKPLSITDPVKFLSPNVLWE